MENKIIDAQLSANGAGLGWGHSYLKGSDLRELRNDLIKNRIELRRIRYAAGVNPAAAVFGESQVGKSYMVDCLLTSEVSPLNVYDGEWKPLSFIDYINPTGEGKESTSLVSRFTTKQVWTDPRYPVRVEMLSPVDVALVLIDSYFNDVKGQNIPKPDAVVDEISRIKEKYGNLPKSQSVVTEDDVFELKEYFESGSLSKRPDFADSLRDSRYFEAVSEVIDKVPVNQWIDVFGFLWCNNPMLSDIFVRLINTMQRMDFARTVYTNLAAVNKLTGTILHVDRIYEFFGIESVQQEDKGEILMIDKASEPMMSVLTDKGKEISNIEKSEFCAIAMEVDFTIVNCTDEKACQDLYTEKPFLKDLDILDFPGARSRHEIEESDITKADGTLLLLRGKVAYLFNKYSRQYLITNLLFCQHDTMSNVTSLKTLLQGWVDRNVGATPEERAEFMRTTEVPPLFIIGTKFNIDLKRKPDDSHPDEAVRIQSLANRWVKRFGNLKAVISPSGSSRWLQEWVPGEAFKNVYLLRSFKYSCQDGIYEGYQEKDPITKRWETVYTAEGRMQGEQNISEDYVELFQGLEKTFLDNEFAMQHFGNAKKSWDEAVIPGRDGSAWIIDNLKKSGSKMAQARDITFNRLAESTMKSLCNALKKHFHDDNSDSELRRALESAGRIELLLDGLFGKDKYFFSDFINSLLVHEDEINDTILSTVNSVKVLDDTDMSTLFAIRNRAKIDPTASMEENRRRMRDTYHFSTDAELDAFLVEMKLTMEDIINPPMVRNLGRIIVEAVEKYWMDTYLTVENFRDFIDRGMTEKGIESLLSNMRVLYKDKLKMTERMTARLAPYVTARENLDDMAEMLADICAEMLNKFINTIGTAYFEDELWQDVRDTVSHNGFDVKVGTIYTSDINFDEEKTRQGLNDVFDVFDNVDVILNQVPVDTEKLSYFSNYHAFREWTDMMKIAFLATCGIPKYDVNMNNELRNVLVKFIVGQPDIKSMLRDEYGLNELKTLEEAGI